MSNNFASFKIEKIVDHHAKVAEGLHKAATTSALVGVPEEKAGRRTKKGQPINNATLAYIHEKGSDRANMPQREFMRPGIERKEEEINAHLAKALKVALAGNPAGVDQEFSKAGQAAVNSIRGVFVNNDWPKVKPATQKRKGKDKNQTLIDSGQLRKSITYVVRGRNAKAW